MCGWVGIVPSSEVPVVAGDNGVLLSHLDVLPVPLADAGPTGVGQHHTPNLSQGLVLQRGGGGGGGGEGEGREGGGGIEGRTVHSQSH